MIQVYLQLLENPFGILNGGLSNQSAKSKTECKTKIQLHKNSVKVY